jgi:hypothetical protein
VRVAPRTLTPVQAVQMLRYMGRMQMPPAPATLHAVLRYLQAANPPTSMHMHMQTKKHYPQNA